MLGVSPFVQTLDLAIAQVADLKAHLQALETVCLELIAERDRAVAELERVSQLSLLADPA